MRSPQDSNIPTTRNEMGPGDVLTDAALRSFISVTTSKRTDKADVSIGDSLWRGVLLVEPDVTVLNAETLLLANSDYCVTPAFCSGELFVLRDTKAVALAILSDRLGHVHLGAVASTVRRQWPRARILIMGQAATILEDHLYDEQVCHSSDPKQILVDLETLYKGLWNQRTNTLDWNGDRSVLCLARPLPPESDPTKAVPRALHEDKTPRDAPSDIRIPATRRN